MVMYDWMWYTGSSMAMPPRGQPTDSGDLDEDDPLQTGFIVSLVLSLLAGKFVGTLACVYLDKAFTSNKLARALDEQGVSMVGMHRTSGRPKAMPRGAEN